MNAIIVYATNSGGTYLAAQYIRDVLQEQGHEVTLKKARDCSVEEFSMYDVVVLGSPSWYVAEKEGQAHQDITALFDRLGETRLDKKKIAVFGLGDNSYAYFCGAVDIIEAWVKKKNALLALPSLRVNEFYFKPEASASAIKQWAHKLSGRLEPTKRGRRVPPQSAKVEPAEPEPTAIKISKQLLWSVGFGLIIGIIVKQVVFGLLIGIAVGLMLGKKKSSTT